MRRQRFAGVLGWPLTYTMSPVIHNAALRAMGIDWVYLAWPVPPEDLAQAIAGLRVLGAVGANVTMPHKAAVLEHLDDLSGDARAIGAVNTIQALGGKLIGHNTDVDGFVEFVTRDAGLDLRDRSVLLLGAGGAARAVSRALGILDTAQLTVSARDESRAEEVAALCSGAAVATAPWSERLQVADGSDVIVNATPLGGAGEDPLQSARLGERRAVIDIVYEPPATPLVSRARSEGTAAWGGLGMLVHQAAASLRIWTGQDPPLETMSAAALRGAGHR